MQERLQPSPLEKSTDRRPRHGGETAQVWLRILDLRPRKDKTQPPAQKSPGLGGRAKNMIQKRWRPSQMSGWRLPPGLILGGGVTVIAIAIIMTRTARDPSELNTPTAGDWTTAGDWESQEIWQRPDKTPEVAADPAFAPDSSRAQSPVQSLTPRVATQQDLTPTSDARTISPLPPLPPSTDRPYEPRMAVGQPGDQAVSPQLEAEFEGIIERPPYKAQHDNNRPIFH